MTILKHFTHLGFVLMGLVYIPTFLLGQMKVPYTSQISFIGSLNDHTKRYTLQYFVHDTNFILMTGVGPIMVKPRIGKTEITKMGTRID